ncbi:hypothetical protein H4582DRAFT_2074805 [Lactarius indigo]|nr:hypothetical protein H4582DRAFT_2074805 [Lactarius indigo]
MTDSFDLAFSTLADPCLWPAPSPLDSPDPLDAFDSILYPTFEREICSNFNCCGLNIPDLHELLAHFEAMHVESIPVIHDEPPYHPPTDALHDETHVVLSFPQPRTLPEGARPCTPTPCTPTLESESDSATSPSSIAGPPSPQDYLARTHSPELVSRSTSKEPIALAPSLLTTPLFTKCKESLQDGRRLENISWRLWYRELAAHTRAQRHLPTPHDSPPHSPHPNSVTCPLTPVSEKGSSERPGKSFLVPSHLPTLTPPAIQNRTRSLPPLSIPQLQSPPAGRRSRPLRSRSKPNPPPVGKIICDMIPEKLDLAPAKLPSVLVNPDPVIVAADPGVMLVAPIPSMLLPPPSTPPTTVGIFPRVVVVNPTPHPTPPATPVPAGPPSPLPSSAQHLAPPPRQSAAVSRHHPPDATTPSNPVPPVSSPLQLLTPVPVAVATPQPQPHHQSQLLRLQSQPQPQPEPQPQRPVDDTLKPSDRRFFLQQDQSPSPERDVQDRGSNGSISTGKSPSETGEVQPSSVTSNQTRASAASASSHPTGRSRSSRNGPARPTMARLNSGRHVVQVTRKEPTKARTASLLAKADKAAASKVAGSSRQQRSPVEPQPPPPKAQHMNGATNVAPKGATSNSGGTGAGAGTGTGTGGAPRRGIVVSNSSSEYETTDTEEDDDDSWASGDISEGPAETATMRPADKRPPTKEETRLREAALEAQRQRELFVKQPKRSYSNLGRTQSGLLSQLLNPDPTVFPPGRPYRVSSTHDVTRPSIPSALTSSKSPVALPQAAQITAQAPMGAATSSGRSNGNGNVNGSGGYRPKGRPQGEELEDESDSPDDPDDTIQVSHSLAQQRLAALANPARRRASDNQGQPQAPGMGIGGRPLLQTVATAPIPLNHPWNLPVPAPPTTPRTTRRQMLATELSESLRRNLLWERQVSKTNLLGNGGRRNGNVLGGGGGTGTGGLRTVVTVNGNAQAGPSQQQQQQQQQPRQQQQQQQQQQQRQGSSAGAGDGATGAAVEDNVAERRRRALARNRTWDDFHYFGW